MSTAETSIAKDREAQRDEFVGRLFEATLGAMDIYAIYLGDRLGLYRALADGGALTSSELAVAARCNERYVREWLEHQAAGGVLEVDDVHLDAGERRFSLPKAFEEVLLDETSLNYAAPFARLVAGAALPLPQLLGAFRTGEGVPYGSYGADLREGQAAFTRPLFERLLGTEWLPAIADVHARLQEDPPARVLDVACGGGVSSISTAKAYPKAVVDGVDEDQPSIDLANSNLAGSGVEDRVTFHAEDAAKLQIDGGFDLITIFEALHDMAHPVTVLSGLRQLLAEEGSLVIGDERTADAFTAPGDEIERLYYGFSILHCLPVGMGEGAAGTGTVMRADTVRRYASEAGFSECEVLPIENDFWRFYRLRP